MRNLLELMYWTDYPNWERLWIKAGADKGLARHLWEKQRGHNSNPVTFYGNLDKENSKRFIWIVNHLNK